MITHVEVDDDSQPHRLGTRKSIVHAPPLFREGERERREGGRSLPYEKVGYAPL